MKRGSFRERELNKAFFIILISLSFLLSLITILPVVSAKHCSSYSINKCEEEANKLGFTYCKEDEIWRHGCRILTNVCANVESKIDTCTTSYYCSEDRTQLCKGGGCVAPTSSNSNAYCEEECVDCQPPGTCVDKNPFGPGCAVVIPPGPTDETLGLGNIKNLRTKSFLFALLVILFILIIFICLRPKIKRPKKCN